LTASVEPLEENAQGLFEELHQAGIVANHSVVVVIATELGIKLPE
jgi:hypothetical protein